MSFIGSALHKAGDHFAAKDAQSDPDSADWAEIWGRRIGRAAGAVFFLVLIVNLFTHWLF